MLAGYSLAVQNVLQRARNLGVLAPVSRLNYVCKFQVNSQIEKMWGTAISIGDNQESQRFSEILEETEDVILVPYTVPDFSESSLLSDEIQSSIETPACLVVYLESLSEEEEERITHIEQSLQWLSVLIVSSQDEFLSRWAKFTSVRSTDVDRNECILVYRNTPIWDGSLLEISMPMIDAAFKHFNRYETLHILSQPCFPSIDLLDGSNSPTQIDLRSGLFLIDFYDDKYTEMLSENSALLEKSGWKNDLNIIEVYAGKTNSTYKYHTGKNGINSKVCQEWQVFEVPTSFMVHNGKIIWRGNRIFDNILMVLNKFSEGKPIPYSEQNEVSISNIAELKNFYQEILDQFLSENSNIEIDMTLYTQLDISDDSELTEKYRTKLIAYLEDPKDEKKCLKFYESLRQRFPNILYEFILKEADKTLKVLNTNNDVIKRIEEGKDRPPKPAKSEQKKPENTSKPIENKKEETAKPKNKNKNKNKGKNEEAKMLEKMKVEFEAMKKSLEDSEKEKKMLKESLSREQNKNRDLASKINLMADKEKRKAQKKKKKALEKDDKSKFLESRNNELLEKQVALEKSLNEVKKVLREQTGISKKLKEELEESLGLVSNRDSQIHTLVAKIKSQEKEINKLSNLVNKKQSQLTHSEQNFSNFKETMATTTLSNQKSYRDTQSQLNSKDEEIAMLKGMISELQRDKSKNKLPEISSKGKKKPSVGQFATYAKK